MTSKPEVSIVIPTRNRVARLRRTLGTVLAQEGVALEVVLVDDASDDTTASVLRELARPPVRLVRHESNQGLARARNTGIEAAHGTWLAFLDDDDLWSPRKLAVQLEALQRSGRHWSFAGALLLDEELGLRHAPTVVPSDRVLDRLLAGYPIPAGASNVVADTAVVRRLGGFDVEMAHIADHDLWLRLALAGQPAVCSDTLIAYVQHADNMHFDPDVAGILAELRHLEQKHSVDRQARGVRFDDRLSRRWIADNQLRRGRRWAACRLHLDESFRRLDPRPLGRAVRALVGPRASVGRREARPAMPDWLAQVVEPGTVKPIAGLGHR